MTFPNLAGSPLADTFVMAELLNARVEQFVTVTEPEGEVKAHIQGTVGPFRFHRAWRYWIMQGPLPLDIAREIYAHKERARDVRAGGDAACRDPALWATHYDAEGNALVLDEDGSQEALCRRIEETSGALSLPPLRFVKELTPHVVRSLVPTYHVDTPAGLEYLVAKLRVRGH